MPDLVLTRRSVVFGSISAFAAASCGEAGTPADPLSNRTKAAQPRPDLYDCEGCEGARERAPQSLTRRTRIGPPREPGEQLIIRGTVLAADGRTPAPGVVIYAYQTNADGLYAGGSPESEWSRRHGRMRGWIRTEADGKYEFETIKPAPYPRNTMPAHIHLTVLEPGRRPYWIDDIVFAGEFGVDAEYRRQRENRGGNGIVSLQRDEDGGLLALRDIVLERHP